MVCHTNSAITGVSSWSLGTLLPLRRWRLLYSFSPSSVPSLHEGRRAFWDLIQAGEQICPHESAWPGSDLILVVSCLCLAWVPKGERFIVGSLAQVRVTCSM